MKASTFFERYKYQIPAIIYAILIFVLSSVPGNEYPEEPFVNFDKLVHITEYGLFCLLLIIAFIKSRDLRFSNNWAVWTFLFGMGYGVLDEIHQYFVPLRSTSGYDLMADAVGILSGIVWVKLWGGKFTIFQIESNR